MKISGMTIYTEKEVLALLRKGQGKSMQKDFAKKLGISQQYLSDIFRGRRSAADSPIMLKFLKLERVFRKKKSSSGGVKRKPSLEKKPAIDNGGV